MSTLKINPFEYFTDTNGDPLDAGFIYIGVENLDPETNPISVYYDAALTIPVVQPIRTVNGYVLNAGAPASLFVASAYSVRVRNKNAVQIYYAPSSTVVALNSQLATMLAAGTGANLVGYGATTVKGQLDSIEVRRLKGHVLISDYLPVGYVTDGSVNYSTQIQNAFNAAAANGHILELVGGETYYSTAKISCGCSIIGNGATINAYMEVAANDIELFNFTLVSPQAAYGIFLHGSTPSPRYKNITLDKVTIKFAASATPIGERLGLTPSYIDYLVVRNCNIQYGIQMVSCANYLLTGNILDGDNYQNNNELLHASIKSFGAVADNIFLNSLDNFIDLFSSGHRTVINGNRFIGCKNRLGTSIEIKVSLSDNPANTSSDANGWVEQIVITDNIFFNIQCGAVIANSIINVYYIDGRAVPSFLWAETPRNIIIANNVFDTFDATLAGSGLIFGIQLTQVTAALVQGNVFRNMGAFTGTPTHDAASSCIWIEGCRDVNVMGNKINMNAGTGISFHRVNQDLSIVNNHILDDQNTGYACKYGIGMSEVGSRGVPSVTYSKIQGNTIAASLSSLRIINAASGTAVFSDNIVSDNICHEESNIITATRCNITNNIFEVGATRNQALAIGVLGIIQAHNTITNNVFKSSSGTPKLGLVIVAMRASLIIGNRVHRCTHGMFIDGGGVAGRLDSLVIKDNLSISQTMANFPTYNAMHATDTGSLVADTNLKIT